MPISPDLPRTPPVEAPSPVFAAVEPAKLGEPPSVIVLVTEPPEALATPAVIVLSATDSICVLEPMTTKLPDAAKETRVPSMVTTPPGMSVTPEASGYWVRALAV